MALYIVVILGCVFVCGEQYVNKGVCELSSIYREYLQGFFVCVVQYVKGFVHILEPHLKRVLHNIYCHYCTFIIQKLEKKVAQYINGSLSPQNKTQ